MRRGMSIKMDAATANASPRVTLITHFMCGEGFSYFEVPTGSIPVLLIVSKARGDARNATSRFEFSTSPEPATTAAENVWTN